MVKGSRARRRSPSESEDYSDNDSDSDVSVVAAKPSKGRQKSTMQRTKAGPSQGRGPMRRTSMPGAWESGSDNDSPRKASGRRDGRPQRASKRAESDDDKDEQAGLPRRKSGKARSVSRGTGARAPASGRPKKAKEPESTEEDEARPSPRRRAIRGSTSDQDRGPRPVTDHHATSPGGQGPALSEGLPDDYEEQMRRVIALSLSEQRSAGPSNDPDEDADYLRSIEESQREHEAQQRKKSQEANELAQNNERDFERAREESQEAARGLFQQNGEEGGEDEFQRALRLSMETHATDIQKAAERFSQQRDSITPWLSLAALGHRARERTVEVPAESSSADAPASRVERSTPIPKPESSKAKRPSTQKKKGKTSALNAVPENGIATSPAHGPSRRRMTSATVAESSNNQAIAIRESEPISERTLQARIDLDEPPVTLATLITMCESAFPKDASVEEAMKLSQESYNIERAEYDDDPILAGMLAESAANAAPPPDIQETGLSNDERPPSYLDSAVHPVVDHTKFTSSDYRNEKQGTKMPITKEIREIIRQYQVYNAWAKQRYPEGKSKEGSLHITPPALPASATTDPNAPAEVNASLDEIVRPALREEFTAPQPEASASIMATVAPKHRAVAQRMQNQSRMIGQSRLPGSRPRVKPEAHLIPFGRLQIMEEENEQVMEASRGQMGRATARKVKANPNYKRRGI
ncbi:MAG: hypothetical protein Q9213_001056 [Squamulea squamosa]